MGGYLLFNIEFKSKEDRDKFENHKFKYNGKFRRMFQYKDIGYECFYYPVWMGYADPQETIKEMKKLKIKFTKFVHNDLPTNSTWWDELKQETYSD